MKKKIVMMSVVIGIGILLGLSSLSTPKSKHSDVQQFSAELAKEDIRNISKNLHSVQQQAELAEVRTYLTNRLIELGLEPEIITYPDITDKYGNRFDVNNIVAKIDGKHKEEGSYILLAAHYDSSPKKRAGEDGLSKGAADDGYGIATILEVLRVMLEQQSEFENGIKILFTDAEETGLLGAKMEMEQNFEWYENVSFVINLEARGIKGPAVMFETSQNNSKVIELYKEAKYPVSYSLAADVYRKMPNGSDFTEFINHGLNGINMAVLDNLDYYHTVLDNYENISPSSLQHYGEQVLPIVQTFVNDEKYQDVNYFEETEDAIFFTFLPHILITYSTTTGFIVALIAICVFSYLALITLKISIKDLLKQTGWVLLIAILSLGMGLLISYLLSLIFNMPFSLTYMPKIPNNVAIFVFSIIMTGVIFRGLQRKILHQRSELNGLVGGLGLQMILLVVFMLVLPGGSFLFLIPLVLGSVVLGLSTVNMNHKIKITYELFICLTALITLIIYIPVLLLLHIALTIGALGIVLFIATTLYSIVIPCVYLFLTKEA